MGKKYPQPYLITLPEKGEDGQGFLVVAGHGRYIPFEVKRTFWTYGTPEGRYRGNHAHIATEEVLFAIRGTVEVETLDRSGKRAVFALEHPTQGLYLPPHVWRVIRQSADAALVVMASTEYSEADYLRDKAAWACM